MTDPFVELGLSLDRVEEQMKREQSARPEPTPEPAPAPKGDESENPLLAKSRAQWQTIRTEDWL